MAITIKINKNYSKAEFIQDNISVNVATGLSLYGVEVCTKKTGELYIRHGHSYQNKEGEWAFQNHSFISPEWQKAILEAYVAAKQASTVPVQATV